MKHHKKDNQTITNIENQTANKTEANKTEANKSGANKTKSNPSEGKLEDRLSRHQIELLRDDYANEPGKAVEKAAQEVHREASLQTDDLTADVEPEDADIILPEDHETEEKLDLERDLRHAFEGDRSAAENESVTGTSSAAGSDPANRDGRNTERTKEQAAANTEPPKKKHKGLQIFVTIVLVLLVIGLAVGGFAYGFYFRPLQRYAEAIELQQAGELDEARKVFVDLGDFQDAQDQVKETDLLIAQRYVQHNQYNEALDLLATLEGYEGKGDLQRGDLVAQAQSEYEDHYYALGQDDLKLYDFASAKRNFALAQKYGGHAEAGATLTLLDQTFDQVYEVSYTDNRDVTQADNIMSYLWVHSVVTEGAADLPLGMQEDLSIGEPNPDIFGQAYLNYTFYAFDGAQQYTFSYAGSEMDAAKAAEGEEQRTVVTLAEFDADYAGLVTEKMYDDNGEIVEAPKIRYWTRVTDELVAENVRIGIRNRMWENMTTLGQLSNPEESKPGDMTLPSFKTSTGATWKKLSLEERAQNLIDEEAKVEAIKKEREEADAAASAAALEQLERVKAQNPEAFEEDAAEETAVEEELTAEGEEHSTDEDLMDEASTEDDADKSGDDTQEGTSKSSANENKAAETLHSAEGADAVTGSASADTAGVKSSDDKKTSGEKVSDDSTSKDQDASASDDEQDGTSDDKDSDANGEEGEEEEVDPIALKIESIEAQTAAADAQMTSDYAVLINADTGEILYDKNSDDKMFPASMTKIMTLLVACEHVTDLTDRAVIDVEDINYSAEQGLTTVGFVEGEEVTVGDLLWGMILPSGAVSAQKLAEYVAGTQEDFVAMMNQKVADLGLTQTHFMNVHGNFDEEQYTTAQEMAVIIHAAMQNPLARKVLATQQYTTSFTAEHPTGITVSNRFLKSIEQKTVPGLVLGAKTGFVSRSMFCAASGLISDSGTKYLCVTGHSDTSANCINDHYTLYNMYAR